jgi:hypothetical protein
MHSASTDGADRRHPYGPCRHWTTPWTLPASGSATPTGDGADHSLVFVGSTDQTGQRADALYSARPSAVLIHQW